MATDRRLSNSSPPVTHVLTHKVKPGQEKDFEEWSKKLTANSREYSGFQNVTIIKPSDPTDPEYVVIIHWTSYDDMKKWQESDYTQKMIKESEEFTLSVKHFQEDSGMEIWFDWPKNAKSVLKPAFYKQVIIAYATVVPLIFLMGAIMEPIFAGFDLPGPLMILLNVLIMAPLMTVLMPRITKAFHPWLYPTPKAEKK